MKEITLNNNTKYTFYSSIKELPELNYLKAQTFIAFENSIGNMEAVGKHYERLIPFASAGKVESVVEEVNNLYFSWNAILNGISYKSLCLVALIDSINDVKVGPITDEDYMKLHHQILKDGITSGMVDDLIEELKKKLMMN